MNRPSWDEYYMDMAFYIAQKSLDPNTKHGCVVVDQEHTPLSMGYNSPPRGCIDSEIPLTRPEKYLYMVHAEENAIINAARSGISLKNSTFYITGLPCSKCFRMLLNVGAKTVIYGPVNSKCVSDEDLKAIKKMNLSTDRYSHKVDFVEFRGKIGAIIKNTQSYIEEKCIPSV